MANLSYSKARNEIHAKNQTDNLFIPPQAISRRILQQQVTNERVYAKSMLMKNNGRAKMNKNSKQIMHLGKEFIKSNYGQSHSVAQLESLNKTVTEDV